jgi:O-antigen/teichoic acid export membrane protein
LDDEKLDIRRIDRSLMRGIAWTGMAKWSTQLITWGATIVLARLLNPEAFGIVSMATLYLGFVGLFNEMGIGSAVVNMRDLTPSEIRQIHTLSVGLGVAGFLVACAMAIPIGIIFNANEVPPVIAVLGMSFVVNAFKTVPVALLQREFRFKNLAFNEGCAAVVMAISEVGFALMGFGYWSLVLGELLGMVAGSALAFAWRPLAFAVPQFRKLKRVLSFTLNLLAGRILWYVYSNADFAVVGRAMGKESLGIYQIAWNFSNLPLRKITELIARVTPSAFAAVQQDKALLRRYLLNITEGLSIVTFPLCVGITLVADDFVKLVLGPQWLPAIVPLRLLSVYISMRTIQTIIPQVIIALGDTAFLLRNGVLAIAVMPLAFWIGTHWGLAGVGWAWMVAYPIVAVPMYVKLHRMIDLQAGEYIRSIWPATSGVLAMAVVVLSVRALLSHDMSYMPRLLIQAGAGAATYGATIWWVHRARAMAVWSALRDLRRPKRVDTPGINP